MKQDTDNSVNIYESIEDIQNNLLDWFEEFGRHWIPWKLKLDGSSLESGETGSPYGIWIAEVMLQQTQLRVMMPYWENWMKTFPLVCDLAEADMKDVLLHWQGLGYYSRAQRVHQSSKILLRMIGEKSSLYPSSWPVELDEWMSLPGVGRTTAGSIISSAFDLPSPILDGNVKRILSRLIASHRSTIKNQKQLWKLSNLLLSVSSPRKFNQALMDLGSTICTNQKPKCTCCPLKNYCLAYLKYDPINFPKKNMKKAIPIIEIGIGIIFNKNGEVLIDQRPENSSMGGLWEFPGGKKEPGEIIEKTIEREILEETGIHSKIGEKLLTFDHLFSHKKLRFTVFICEWESGDPQPLASQQLRWVAPNRLFEFPFPAANTKIISAVHKYLGFKN